MKIKRPPIICWFDALPRVSAGVFSVLEQHWGEKIIFIIMQGMDADHKRIGWQEFKYDNEVVRLDIEADPKRKVEEILELYPDAIHYVNGLRSLTRIYLYGQLFPDPTKKIVLWSEIPNLINPRTGKANVLRFFLIRLLNCFYGLKFRNRICGFTPLGQIGCEYFKKCFWRKDSVFPMMYCPPYPTVEEISWENYSLDSTVHFIYMGRLSKLKGCDLLQSVFDSLKEKNWTLDIYGANGNFEEALKYWAEGKNNVHYKGTCTSDKVVQVLGGYDAVIVPSKCEGWNLLPNESFYAGVPVACSNRAGSHEIIETSKGGLVFQANSMNALKQAVRQILKNPKVLQEQRKNIEEYRHRIMPDIVAEYLCSVFDYLCLNSGKRPQCPWLNEGI